MGKKHPDAVVDEDTLEPVVKSKKDKKEKKHVEPELEETAEAPREKRKKDKLKQQTEDAEFDTTANAQKKKKKKQLAVDSEGEEVLEAADDDNEIDDIFKMVPETGMKRKREGNARGKLGDSSENVAYLCKLAANLTEDDLQQHFAECGQIERIQLPVDGFGKPRGIAFIKFKLQAGLDAALALNGKAYEGGKFNVKPYASQKGSDGEHKLTLFVGGFQADLTEDMLRKVLPYASEIEDVHLPLDDHGKPKGIAFVKYSLQAAAKAALRLDGDSYRGRLIKVQISAKDGGVVPPKADKGSNKSSKRSDMEFTVFVANIPWDVTEDLLNQKFKKYGKIQQLVLPKKDGKIKGIAFISYETAAEVQSALKLNDTRLSGRRLKVEVAGQKSDTTKNAAAKGGDSAMPSAKKAKKADNLALAEEDDDGSHRKKKSKKAPVVEDDSSE